MIYRCFGWCTPVLVVLSHSSSTAFLCCDLRVIAGVLSNFAVSRCPLRASPRIHAANAMWIRAVKENSPASDVHSRWRFREAIVWIFIKFNDVAGSSATGSRWWIFGHCKMRFRRWNACWHHVHNIAEQNIHHRWWLLGRTTSRPTSLQESVERTIPLPYFVVHSIHTPSSYWKQLLMVLWC
jgi:hypothetical protein